MSKASWVRGLWTCVHVVTLTLLVAWSPGVAWEGTAPPGLDSAPHAEEVLQTLRLFGQYVIPHFRAKDQDATQATAVRAVR